MRYKTPNWFCLAALLAMSASHAQQAAPQTPWIQVRDRLKDSVVFLQITKTDISTGAQVTVNATGFIVGKDGYVITSAHAIKDPIINPNRTVSKAVYPPDIAGRVGARNPPPVEPLKVRILLENSDLALLQYEDFSSPRAAIPIGKANDVAVGEEISALGFPLDLPYDFRKASVSSKGGVDPVWNVQANFGPGMSGGPVVNAKGEIVGVVRGGDDRAAGFQYVVPINLADSLLTRAQATYAAGATVPTVATTPPIIKAWEVTDIDAPGEDLITRPHTKAFAVPAHTKFDTADVTVIQQNGLVGEVIIDLAQSARVVNVVFQLQSGPKSAGVVGFLKGSLQMTVVPE